MKEKPTFPLLLFKFFFPPTEFLKKIGFDAHPIDVSCHEKFVRSPLTGSGNIDAQS